MIFMCGRLGGYRLTPEELAEAAGDAVLWQQVLRDTTYWNAECVRAAIDIIQRELSRIDPKAPESVEDFADEQLGLEHLNEVYVSDRGEIHELTCYDL